MTIGRNATHDFIWENGIPYDLQKNIENNTMLNINMNKFIVCNFPYYVNIIAVDMWNENNIEDFKLTCYHCDMTLIFVK